jgi:hypothetical protein
VVIAQELLQTAAAMGEVLDMAVEFDAVTGGEDDTVTPLGIVRQLFQGFLEGRRREMESLTQVNRCRCMVEADDNEVHRRSVIPLQETGSSP